MYYTQSFLTEYYFLDETRQNKQKTSCIKPCNILNPLL